MQQHFFFKRTAYFSVNYPNKRKKKKMLILLVCLLLLSVKLQIAVFHLDVASATWTVIYAKSLSANSLNFKLVSPHHYDNSKRAKYIFVPEWFQQITVAL